MDWTDFFSGISSLAPVGTSIAQAVIGPPQPYAIAGAPGAIYLPNAQGGGTVLAPGLGGSLSPIFGGSGSNSTLILLLMGLALLFVLRA